jgi:hypothetical protein
MKKNNSSFFYSSTFFNANKKENCSIRKRRCTRQYLEISGPIVKDLQNLFVEKHHVLLTEGISEERIKVISDLIEHKLAATLDANEMEKLRSDAVLYKKLIKN